ncbi:hypothetical protein AX16_007701 [Volvariella volvacea WC 439]|nr:hypothetical protein AX16_007701 [Volvariella volvacea WC 439]
MKSRHQTSPLSRLILVLYFFWRSIEHVAGQRTITVDDSDPSIIYQPASAWHNAFDTCSSCFSPDRNLAYNQSFHQAVNVFNGVDSSGGGAVGIAPIPPPPSYSIPPPSTSSSTLPPSPTPAPSGEVEDQYDDDEREESTGRQHDGRALIDTSQKTRRRAKAVRADGDEPVTLQFSFTGSAIQVFGLQPPSTTTTPTNLTFTIDGQTLGDWDSTSLSSSSSTPQQQVFSVDGLTEEPHVLVVTVGFNSAFVFDYLVYTQTVNAQRTGEPSSVTEMSNAPSASVIDEQAKKHNTVTFAAAVGGSVGVLTLVALGLAFSIIRRRRLAILRERRERDSESLHTNGSEDSPHMSGPAPFVPRFFPGTVPPDPPPYADTEPSAASSQDTDRTSHPRDTSYADIPPSTPPPPLDDAIFPPPPPFPVAIASPPPSSDLIAAVVQSPPNISRRDHDEDHSSDSSHNTLDVGTPGMSSQVQSLLASSSSSSTPSSGVLSPSHNDNGSGNGSDTRVDTAPLSSPSRTTLTLSHPMPVSSSPSPPNIHLPSSISSR